MVPLIHRHVQRSLLAQSAGVYLGVPVQERLGDSRVALQGRHVQRRVAIAGACLHQLRVSLEEGFDLINVTGADGLEQVGSNGHSAGECQRQP